MQLKRAKRRVDTQDMELAMDLMVVLSKSENRNADKVIIERLAKKLDLQTLPDLREETAAVQKLVKERRSRNREITHQIVDLLNKFIQMSGFEDINELDAVQPKTKSLQRCPSLQIPNEFLCPISLEIMTDPVIVATGQVPLCSSSSHYVFILQLGTIHVYVRVTIKFKNIGLDFLLYHYQLEFF